MFTCEPKTKEELEAWANETGRTLSNLCEQIILDSIAAQRGKNLRTPTQPDEREPTDIHELVRENRNRLKGLGIKNLAAIARGEVLPTKHDFRSIISALEVPDDLQKELWTKTYNGNGNDHPKKGATNGAT